MKNVLPEGVLPLYKPADWTSHDAVAKARKIIGIKRIGHTGTLDPQVSGVLPLCIGRATRVVEYLQDLPKEYEAELTVGFATDTEDLSGEVTEQVEQVRLSAEEVEKTLARFVGTIRQTPPMYSAVRVGGRRLYELAREGKEVERKPRTVHIYRLDLIDMDLDREQPTVRFRTLCSKGTYIRTLCVDIGKALGYPAVMSALRRTAAGPFALEHCVTLEELERLAAAGRLAEAIVPVDRALAQFPAVTVSDRDARKAANGMKLPLPERSAGEAPAPLERVRLYAASGVFVGVFRVSGDALVPEKIFGSIQ